MFLPGRADEKKAERAALKKALTQVRNWTLSCIAAELHEGLILDINEVACGDPSCAPVDTIFTLVWSGGGRGTFGIPLSAKEIEEDDVLDNIPDDDILLDWKNGKNTHWPRRPDLRFEIGDRVECRIGPHPVKGWAPGRVVKLYYREVTWPPSMFAPYQVALHDGRLIFAPQDNDNVIRLRPPPAEDAPSSPEFALNEGADEYADIDNDEEEEDGMDTSNQYQVVYNAEEERKVIHEEASKDDGKQNTGIASDHPETSSAPSSHKPL